MKKCVVCDRDPEHINKYNAECSHVDCPHRRKAWSERPTPAQLYKGPWRKNVDADPAPLDQQSTKGKSE